MLNRENEMSVEELRAMYAGMDEPDKDEIDDVDESQSEMEIEDTSNKEKGATADDKSETKRKRRKSSSDNDLSDRESKRSHDGTAAMKALEASAVKARETLASRPFLLAPWVKMRKYQQVGLNWLVSLQSRRLNGILADGMYDKSNVIFTSIWYRNLTIKLNFFTLPCNLQKWVSGKRCKQYPCLRIWLPTKGYGVHILLLFQLRSLLIGRLN